MRFFDGYVARYLRRHFHRVRLWGGPGGLCLPPGTPLLFAVSHGAWWDVLVGYYLARAVARVESYAPMDEAQLLRYRILNRLGIYSVDRFSPAGVRAFLRYTAGLLKGERAVWITPQGDIVSNHRRPVRFQPGIGHLVRRVPSVAVIPVAVAYEFLREPRPEVFVKFGPARIFRNATEPPGEIARLLARDLERELDTVLAALAERDLRSFSVLLEGATSMSLVYDRVRALRAWLTGRPDPARHGDVVSGPGRVEGP
jgi:1-acyl-sn-glycerol-3-phosphate acyltransferase